MLHYDNQPLILIKHAAALLRLTTARHPSALAWHNVNPPASATGSHTTAARALRHKILVILSAKRALAAKAWHALPSHILYQLAARQPATQCGRNIMDHKNSDKNSTVLWCGGTVAACRGEWCKLGQISTHSENSATLKSMHQPAHEANKNF
jgi:hypothetical protein